MNEGHSAVRALRYASEFDRSGYAIAAARCVRALLAVGLDPAWEPLENTVLGRTRAAVATDAPLEFRARRRPSSPGETLVAHSVPMAWARLRHELQPARMIGHTVWETESLPERWRHDLDCVDEFWVPTEWNRRVFSDTFGRPAHVIPHVIDEGASGELGLALPDDVTVFAAVSAWDWRKRPDRVIEAYLRAFTADDPVVLVVKTTRNVIAWKPANEAPVDHIGRIVSGFSRPARVIVDTEAWGDERMRALFDRADAFVSLTASEGWGLGAFDMAVKGKPVIITGWGGQVEWLGADYPGLIPYNLVPCDHPDRTLFDSSMRWAYADVDSAIDLMRAVATGRAGRLAERARSLAGELSTKYSPEEVGRAAMRALGIDGIHAEAEPMQRAGSPSVDGPESSSVLVLTPVKNAARHAPGYVDRLLALQHPHDRLSVGILVSDSDDGTGEAFAREFERLHAAGIRTTIVHKDFGYRIPAGLPRWAPSIQPERRRVLALSRNHLLFAALRDENWVLWLDADVVEYPSDIIGTLLAAQADIVQPDCVRHPDGPSFDQNAWTDQGTYHLDDYRDFERVELHAVGATMLLVNADRHRDGLVWPAYRHGVVNPRARTRYAPEDGELPGEVETEGLGMMAYDLGIGIVGLPQVRIVHE